MRIGRGSWEIVQPDTRFEIGVSPSEKKPIQNEGLPYTKV